MKQQKERPEQFVSRETKQSLVAHTDAIWYNTENTKEEKMYETISVDARGPLYAQKRI